MRKLAVLGLALMCLLAAGVSHAAWNPDWKHRAKIGLNTAADGLPIGAAVDSVPVLVRLHTGNFQFVDAKPDGTDLRFIAADDKTPLKFHIEKFDGLNEIALIWVQVPKLAPGNKAGRDILNTGTGTGTGTGSGSGAAFYTGLLLAASSTPCRATAKF